MSEAALTQIVPCSRRDLLLYFLRLGALGFGGPIALAGYMQRDLVEARRWIAKHEYVDGLALAQLSPGPLAAQLAMYLGWVRGGALGAAAVGVAFVLPSFLMVLAIAWAYMRYGGLPWIQGAFYGIGAAVIAIIVRSTESEIAGRPARRRHAAARRERDSCVDGRPGAKQLRAPACSNSSGRFERSPRPVGAARGRALGWTVELRLRRAQRLTCGFRVRPNGPGEGGPLDCRRRS
jgi:chromate transport protein ChrA